MKLKFTATSTITQEETWEVDVTPDQLAEVLDLDAIANLWDDQGVLASEVLIDAEGYPDSDLAELIKDLINEGHATCTEAWTCGVDERTINTVVFKEEA